VILRWIFFPFSPGVIWIYRGPNHPDANAWDIFAWFAVWKFALFWVGNIVKGLFMMMCTWFQTLTSEPVCIMDVLTQTKGPLGTIGVNAVSSMDWSVGKRSFYAAVPASANITIPFSPFFQPKTNQKTTSNMPKEKSSTKNYCEISPEKHPRMAFGF